jgi:hypothetical protein
MSVQDRLSEADVVRLYEAARILSRKIPGCDPYDLVAEASARAHEESGELNVGRIIILMTQRAGRLSNSCEA